MNRLRAPIISHPLAAMLLVILCLGMKMLVPSGFMLVSHNMTITAMLCSGDGQTQKVTIPIERDDSDRPSTDTQSCDGAMPDKAAGGAVDALLLDEALAFILALGFAAVTIVALRSPPFLHPPLRGPPATI